LRFYIRGKTIKKSMDLFNSTTGMEVNLLNSFVTFYGLSESHCIGINWILPFKVTKFTKGLKYLGLFSNQMHMAIEISNGCMKNWKK